MLAEFKKAFAVAHNCTERTARRHFVRKSPEYQAFIAKQGIEAAKNLQAAAESTPAQAVAIQILSPASPADLEKPNVANQPDEALSEPERILKQQWLIYDHASKAWAKALQDGDEMKAYALGQATIKAQDAYYKARGRHDQWLLDQRRNIPAAEFHTFRAGFIIPLANLLRNLPAQLGQIMNPKDAPYAIRVGTDYMVGTVHPAIERLINALDDHAPGAAVPQLAA